MDASVSIEDVAEAMYRLVRETTGVRKLSATDLTKAMVGHFGEGCDRQLCKQALRQLIDSGRCIYTYYGGASYVELASQERREV